MHHRNLKRKVLVILSNRLAPLDPARFFEIECDDQGSVLSEHRLRRAPTKAIYDEVWENDEGKTQVEGTHRFKRRYGHRWQKARG